MSGTEELMKRAGELGRKIAETEEYAVYKQLSDSINADETKKQIVDTYIEILGKIQAALADNNVPVELKDRYELCARELNSDAQLLQFIRAQEAYIELINECVSIISDL